MFILPKKTLMFLLLPLLLLACSDLALAQSDNDRAKEVATIFMNALSTSITHKDTSELNRLISDKYSFKACKRDYDKGKTIHGLTSNSLDTTTQMSVLTASYLAGSSIKCTVETKIGGIRERDAFLITVGTVGYELRCGRVMDCVGTRTMRGRADNRQCNLLDFE